MGILPAIFTDAGRIGLDVARVIGRLVKWRGEEERQIILRTNQLPIGFVHGGCGALRSCPARQDSPRLGNGIDAAFLALGRAKRCAIVKKSAAIPASIPAVLFKCGLKFLYPVTPGGGAFNVAAFVCNRSKGFQGREQEPAKPNAFAFSRFANAVHAVIPVAGADQRQAVGAMGQAAIKGAGAMLIQGGGFLGQVRAEKRRRVRPAQATGLR